MVPNCNNRQLDLVLSGRSGVTVCAADEGLQPVDAYHPPLAVGVAASCAPTPTHPTPAARDYEAFSQCRARVKAETVRCHLRYRDRVQNHLATDPKSFWNYVRSTKDTSGRYKLIKEGRVLAGDECAEEYARFFHSVYSSTAGTLSAEAARGAAAPSGAYAHLACLEPAAVRSALTCLPPKRLVGPDVLGAFIHTHTKPTPSPVHHGRRAAAACHGGEGFGHYFHQ
ncbi:hypothetical protein PYW07_001864 [Mythimna separata]|uniref:Uncharacterized protein n=1 Tax=Mythimna separata TaxID=271217 RepID=A0AAD8DW88_MYTSE|nr:hypothetical protein PYW07_001864 [Mythimna separata]